VNATSCGRLDDVIAELALGLLDGAERAAALAHIEHCPDCQAEVAALTATGEQLLLLAPEIPPPTGFESRVLGRIEPAPEALNPLGPSGAGRSGRRSPRRWRPRSPRRLVLVAAALLVVVGGLTALLAGWVGPSGSDDAVVSTQMLSERGRVVGTATLRHSSPPVMEVDLDGWVESIVEHGGQLDERWWLAVEETDGSKDMYAVELTRSDSSWVTLDGEADEVAAVALVDDTGRTWCSGRFPT